MYGRGRLISRREQLIAMTTALCMTAWGRHACAFGQSGAFRVRQIRLGLQPPDPLRETAAARWAWELMRRTSAPARLEGRVIQATSPQLLEEPFAVWSGVEDPGRLSNEERRALDRFLRLGGLLLVDDSNPALGSFGRGARRELTSLLADTPIQSLGPQHVVLKSFYLIERPVGRVAGSGRIDAILRGNLAQVLILDCDLLGALATQPQGNWALPTLGSDTRQREHAIRLAINIAMYLLCSDYKDDQVHAAWLMRHRQAPKK